MMLLLLLLTIQGVFASSLTEGTDQYPLFGMGQPHPFNDRHIRLKGGSVYLGKDGILYDHAADGQPSRIKKIAQECQDEPGYLVTQILTKQKNGDYLTLRSVTPNPKAMAIAVESVVAYVAENWTQSGDEIVSCARGSYYMAAALEKHQFSEGAHNVIIKTATISHEDDKVIARFPDGQIEHQKQLIFLDDILDLSKSTATALLAGRLKNPNAQFFVGVAFEKEGRPSDEFITFDPGDFKHNTLLRTAHCLNEFALIAKYGRDNIIRAMTSGQFCIIADGLAEELKWMEEHIAGSYSYMTMKRAYTPNQENLEGWLILNFEGGDPFTKKEFPIMRDLLRYGQSGKKIVVAVDAQLKVDQERDNILTLSNYLEEEEQSMEKSLGLVLDYRDGTYVQKGEPFGVDREYVVVSNLTSLPSHLNGDVHVKDLVVDEQAPMKLLRPNHIDSTARFIPLNKLSFRSGPMFDFDSCRGYQYQVPAKFADLMAGRCACLECRKGVKRAQVTS